MRVSTRRVRGESEEAEVVECLCMCMCIEYIGVVCGIDADVVS
jgi:hypothetical protein